MYGNNLGAPFMMPNMSYMQMPVMNGMANGMRSLGGLSQAAGKTGLLGGIKGINFSGILNNVSKTLGVVKEAIPIVKEVKPMITNMKSMLKIASAFSDVTENEKKVETLKETFENTKNTTNTINNVSSTNQSTPNFFL